MPNNPINLTLMIGPVVPVPVSQEVLDALTSVTVTTNSDTRQRFPTPVHAQQSLEATNHFSALERRGDSAR